MVPEEGLGLQQSLLDEREQLLHHFLLAHQVEQGLQHNRKYNFDNYDKVLTLQAKSYKQYRWLLAYHPPTANNILYNSTFCFC